jgi:hypothetical protein
MLGSAYYFADGLLRVWADTLGFFVSLPSVVSMATRWVLYQISQTLPDVLYILVPREIWCVHLGETLTGLNLQVGDWRVWWRRNYGCYVALNVVNDS